MKSGVAPRLLLAGLALGVAAGAALVFWPSGNPGKPESKEAAVPAQVAARRPAPAPTLAASGDSSREPPPAAASAPVEASGKANGSQPPAGANAPPGTISTEVLSELLQRALNDDWAMLDERVRSLSPVSHPTGDRKAAREANKAGLEYFQNGEFDKAAVEFRKALEASPKDIEVRNNLAFAVLKSGRHEQSIGLLAETLMADPTRASAWSNLAEAFAETGKLPASQAAVKLVVHFSRNQAKTIEFLLDAEKIESAKLRGVIQAIAPQFERIPAFPR